MAPGPTLKGYLYVVIVEGKDLPDTGEGKQFFFFDLVVKLKFVSFLGVDAIDTYAAVFLDGMEEGNIV